MVDRRPAFLPIADLARGSTIELELRSMELLDEAFAAAAEWRRRRPDVGLLVPAGPGIADAVAASGLEPGAVVVEVPAAKLHEQGRLPAGVRLSVGQLGSGPVDVAALCRLRPALVRVDASAFASGRGRTILAAGIGLGRSTGAVVFATGVDSVAALRTVGTAGADAVQGPHVAPPLRGVEQVLARLAEEAPAALPAPADPVADVLGQLEQRAARIEQLVGAVSEAVARGASPAAPRSARTAPRAR